VQKSHSGGRTPVAHQCRRCDVRACAAPFCFLRDEWERNARRLATREFRVWDFGSGLPGPRLRSSRVISLAERLRLEAIRGAVAGDWGSGVQISPLRPIESPRSAVSCSVRCVCLRPLDDVPWTEPAFIANRAGGLAAERYEGARADRNAPGLYAATRDREIFADMRHKQVAGRC
jgi:hypothetical protein